MPKPPTTTANFHPRNSTGNPQYFNREDGPNYISVDTNGSSRMEWWTQHRWIRTVEMLTSGRPLLRERAAHA